MQWLSALLIGVAACSGASGSGSTTPSTGPSSGTGGGGDVLRCTDLIVWAAEGEDFTEPDVTLGAPGTPDPLPPEYTYWDTLICPVPAGYSYATDHHVIDIYAAGGVEPCVVVDDVVHATPQRGPDGSSLDRAVEIALERTECVDAIARGPGPGGVRPVRPVPRIPGADPATPLRVEVRIPPGSRPPLRPLRVVRPKATLDTASVTTPLLDPPGQALRHTGRGGPVRGNIVSELSTRVPEVFRKPTDTDSAQANMIFWSGKGNRARAIAVLRALSAPGARGVRRDAERVFARQKAYWDEGWATSGNSRFQEYLQMIRQAWYPRKELQPDGRFSYRNELYLDPHTVTDAQADLIWDQYSMRYTETALDIYARNGGNTVDVYCLVEGAFADRVFARAELPILRALAAPITVGGVRHNPVVRLLFPRNSNPDPNNRGHWTSTPPTFATPPAPSFSFPRPP